MTCGRENRSWWLPRKIQTGSDTEDEQEAQLSIKNNFVVATSEG